jgi:hypothetical protein
MPPQCLPPLAHCGRTVLAGRRRLTPGREELRPARWLSLAKRHPTRLASGHEGAMASAPRPGLVAHPHGPSWAPPWGARAARARCQSHTSAKLTEAPLPGTAAAHLDLTKLTERRRATEARLPSRAEPWAPSCPYRERESADRESVFSSGDGSVVAKRGWGGGLVDRDGGGTHVRYFHFTHESKQRQKKSIRARWGGKER